MKIRILLSLFLSIACLGFCQAQIIRVTFFNRANNVVKTRDSAYYIRTIYEMDKVTSLYDLKEVYANGNVRRVGKTSSLANPVFDGACTVYYANGAKSEELTYQHGHVTGDVYQYFTNGKLHRHMQVRERPANLGHGYFAPYKILAVNDSLGKAEVVDGNGHYIDNFFFPFTDVVCEGYLKDGLREGQWKGIKKNKGGDPINFTEVYKDGKFLSGFSVDASNKTYTYVDGEQEILPKYKLGDQQGFNDFLVRHIMYPDNARKNNITGLIYVTFTVEKDGTIDDIKVPKVGRPQNPELAAEAVRVVQESPNWEPGRLFGQPAALSYTVPINFTLGKTR